MIMLLQQLYLQSNRVHISNSCRLPPVDRYVRMQFRLILSFTRNNARFNKNLIQKSYFSNENNEIIDNDDEPLSNISKLNQTMEKWFESIIKPSTFYKRHGEIHKSKNNTILNNTTSVTTPSSQVLNEQQQQLLQHHVSSLTLPPPIRRCYFYNIDLHGRLYLEESMPKNITSSIKDIRFLDFFFSRIKYIDPIQIEYMTVHDIPVHDYPFISICQNEWNFIRPACTPIIFHSLVDHEQFLLYGSTSKSLLREPFNETTGIVVSKYTGMLYHTLTTHSYYPLSRKFEVSSEQRPRQQYALIRSTVALSLSDRIVELPQDNDAPTDPSSPSSLSLPSPSGLGFITKYDRIVPIMYLPDYAEPGLWSMSYNNTNNNLDDAL